MSESSSDEGIIVCEYCYEKFENDKDELVECKGCKLLFHRRCLKDLATICVVCQYKIKKVCKYLFLNLF